MRPVDPALEAHLSGEVTTLCRCWRVTRRDGAVLGFTDHDRDLAFDGTVFEAGSGLAAGEMQHSHGLNAESQEVEGALSSDRITEADIRADRYDGAKVEAFLVNWNDPAQRMLERVLTVGEVVREDGAFRAEVRGAAASLDQTQGRRFSRVCDADLGDARCGVDPGDPRWTAECAVARVLDELTVEVNGLDGFGQGWFRGGRAFFLTGAGEGGTAEIAGCQPAGAATVLSFWSPPPTLAPGDAIRVLAGCDKHFATCRDRFDNAVNFRGFPHMPGNDFSLGFATAFGVMDGGALKP